MSKGIRLVLAGLASVSVLCNQATEKRSIDTIKIDETQYMEICSADSVAFYWKAPSFGVDNMKCYQLFYRTLDGSSWIHIRDIAPSLNPEIVIHRNEIVSPDSVFLFGVQYMMNDSTSSKLHSSSDPTAAPMGAWYLLWKK